MPIFRNYNVKNKHLPVKKIHKDREKENNYIITKEKPKYCVL